MERVIKVWGPDYFGDSDELQYIAVHGEFVGYGSLPKYTREDLELRLEKVEGL